MTKFILVAVLLVGVAFIVTRSQTKTAETDIPQTINNQGVKNMDIAELKIEDLVTGTGDEVKSGDTIIIHYNGSLLDGTKFDSSYDRNQPFETGIGVGQVIEGWDKGVIGMKVGGKRRLTIPSAMAYGDRGIPGAIPAKAALVFEVELLRIK